MLNKNASVRDVADEMSRLVPKLIRGARGNMFSHNQLTSAQIIVLMNLWESKESKISPLAESMGVSMPTMSGIIERMVKQGYIERIRNNQDRRCAVVSLTARGEEIVGDFRKAVRKRWSQILVYLSPAERVTYVSLIKKIIEAMEKSKKSG